MLKKVGYALGGGLVAGSLVGAAEAAYVLQSTTPSEYQALIYGAVLYGLIGGGMGLGIGVVLAFVGSLSPARRWTVSFAGVVFALGVFILRYIVNKDVYAEMGVPMKANLAIAGGLGLTCLVEIWLGTLLLTKTPLRVIPGLKGTAVLWGGGLGLSWVFSMMPAPGASGDTHPDRKQGPEFANKPDILLVMIDTTRADALEVYGAPTGASPNLLRFSKDAVTFDQYVTSASWTRASTASLMTSLTPSSHTCAEKTSALPAMVKTLAEVMQDGGYVTGGLPNNANVTAAQGFGQGFDWFPYNPEYPLGAKESTYALSMYAAVRKAATHVTTYKHVEEYYQPAEKQLPHAHDFMELNKDHKWFMFVHLMEPHDPYFNHPYDGEAYGRAEHPNPPADLKDKLRTMYAGEIKHVDEELGKLFDELKKDGRYDDMAIIVTADHGEEFLEHGGWWHGDTLYDEQIHVPLMVKLPKNQRAGTRVPWQVREVDIAPTIATLGGLSPDATWQGSPIFEDQFEQDLALLQPPAVDPAAPVDTAAPEFKAPDWTNHPASRDALSEQDFEGYELQSIRKGGKKVIEALRVPADNAHHQAPVQFYDLMADPTEQKSLDGQGSSEEAALQAQLERLVSDAKSKAVQAEGHEASAAERARLCALGYMSGPECEGVNGGTPAPQ